MDVEVTIASMKLEQVATMQLVAWEGEGESVGLPCDMFWEDKQTRYLKEHIGGHPQLITRTVRDPRWPDIIQRLPVVVNDLEISRKKMLCLVFACHHGKHRSVSVAEAVHMILNDMGYKCKLMHIQLETVRGCCCRECTWPQDKPSDLIKGIKGVAVRSWKTHAPP